MLEKLTRPLYFVYTFVNLVRDPNQLENVFRLIDRVDDAQNAELPAGVAEHPAIKSYLERPSQLLHIDLDALATLRAGTLGRVYADWMRKRGLSPKALQQMDGDSDMARVRNHAIVTHDIWHVVTGFDTDVAGEVGLQAFYLAQNDGPIPIALMSAALLNSLVYAREDVDRRMDSITRGWTLGKSCQPLFGTDWSLYWEMPLDEVRHRFEINDLPSIKQSAHKLAA